MKRIIILSVLVVGFLLSTTLNSFACSCAKPDPTITLEQRVAEVQKQYKAIFSGKVLKIEQKIGSSFVNVEFQIDKRWKRNLPETVTILTTDGKGGNCGFPFSVGITYLVYAHGGEENDTLFVGTCSRTTNIERAEEDLKVLGEGIEKPKKEYKE